jgi:hypothetical protein
MAGSGAGQTHDHAVIPGKDGELTEARHKVPSSSDVASYEDAERENREWVHRSRAPSPHESSMPEGGPSEESKRVEVLY